MSSFVVSNATINTVTTYLSTLEGQRAAYCELTSTLPHLGFDLAYDAEAPAQLGRAMHNLNVQATNYRYDEQTEPRFTPRRSSLANATAMRALKALRCWLYQCAEGDFDKDPLYLAMEKTAAEIALYIVGQLPEYESIPWDISED